MTAAVHGDKWHLQDSVLSVPYDSLAVGLNVHNAVMYGILSALECSSQIKHLKCDQLGYHLFIHRDKRVAEDMVPVSLAYHIPQDLEPGQIAVMFFAKTDKSGLKHVIQASINYDSTKSRNIQVRIDHRIGEMLDLNYEADSAYFVNSSEIHYSVERHLKRVLKDFV